MPLFKRKEDRQHNSHDKGIQIHPSAGNNKTTHSHENDINASPIHSLPTLRPEDNESDYSLYESISNTSISDLPHQGHALSNSNRSRTSSVSSKFKNLFSSTTSLVEEFNKSNHSIATNSNSNGNGNLPVSAPQPHLATTSSNSNFNNPAPKRSASLRNGATSKDQQRGINPDIIHKQKHHNSNESLASPPIAIANNNNNSNPIKNNGTSANSSPIFSLGTSSNTNRTPPSQPVSPPLSATGSFKSPSLEPQLDQNYKANSGELLESLNKLKIMPAVIENDIDEVLSKNEDELYSLSDSSSLNQNLVNSNPMVSNKSMNPSSTQSTNSQMKLSSSSSNNSPQQSHPSHQFPPHSQAHSQSHLQLRGRSMLPKFLGGGSHSSNDSRSTSPESRSNSHTNSQSHLQNEVHRRASVSIANTDQYVQQYNLNHTLYNNALKHTSTSISNSSSHLSSKKDNAVSVKSGRIKIYNNGESHEHDYSKYRTQPTKNKSSGIWGWTRRKDAEDSTDESVENSISLLPDTYSSQLMSLKANPENYRWNYDESDDDESSGSDSDSDSDKSANGYSDGDNNDDDDDDDGDDFDDEADNELIEPIIGKDQLNLINLMMGKIEHPEQYKEKLTKAGSSKLPLNMKFGKIEGTVGRGSYGTVKIAIKCDPENKKIKRLFAIKQLKQRPNETLHHFGNRVTSEFMISSSLTHQAVTNVYDLMVDPISMTYSQVMEYIPCGDLFTLIAQTNGLEVIEADCFFKQILNAITYLHSVGISHNDLKVENLLLTKIGQLKITDFGTSAVFKTAWEDKVQLSKGACGSERYVSPEQFVSDKEYDPRLADIWSLGIIYLVMLYGTYFWEVAKPSDPGYEHFLETRAIYDYDKRSTTFTKQYKLKRKGVFNQIESISKGYYPNSRRYVLYNILQPDPKKRMRSYKIWQSDWVKSIHVCDAGRGYVSSDEYLEMAKRAYLEYHDKGSTIPEIPGSAASSVAPSRAASPIRALSPSRTRSQSVKAPSRVTSPIPSDSI